MNKQYWIIDTGGNGESMNTREASGPYPTKKAAEKAVLKDYENFWDDACTCLKEGCDKDGWCEPLLIVEVVRTVVPKITAKIQLVDA
jgi:hypothetical protein